MLKHGFTLVGSCNFALKTFFFQHLSASWVIHSSRPNAKQMQHPESLSSASTVGLWSGCWFQRLDDLSGPGNFSPRCLNYFYYRAFTLGHSETLCSHLQVGHFGCCSIAGFATDCLPFLSNVFALPAFVAVESTSRRSINRSFSSSLMSSYSIVGGDFVAGRNWFESSKLVFATSFNNILQYSCSVSFCPQMKNKTSTAFRR